MAVAMTVTAEPAEVAINVIADTTAGYVTVVDYIVDDVVYRPVLTK